MRKNLHPVRSSLMRKDMIKLFMKTSNGIQNNSGFVILFAVTLSAILLSIALGVANIAQKEIRFGTSARDTNNAFFAADTGIECALVYDKSSSSSFPVAGPASDINCASAVLSPTFTGTSNTGLFTFTITNLVGTSCTKVSVFKDNTNPLSINTTIIAKGYNNGGNVAGVCNPSSNSLERELKTSYSTGPGISTPVAQNVTWKNIVGVNASGNNLTKTAPSGWGNAGASSVENIVSGDGYGEFSVNETNLGKMGGLSNGDSNQDYTDIDFAINPNALGVIAVYEKGIQVYNAGVTYVPTDIFRVSVESGVVKYYKNGALLYTSLATPVYPLVLDTALNSLNATITNAKITGTSGSPQPLSLVNQSTASATSGNIVTVNIPTPTVGNALILAFGSSPNTATITSVSGGGVTTWAKAQSSNVNRDAEIWYGLNSSGSGTTVTVNLSAALTGSGGLANVSEWSGLSSSGVDVSGSSNGTTSNATTTTLNTTNANDLIIAMARNGSATPSGPSNSFTALNSPNSAAFQAAYRIVSSTGSYSTFWTLTGTTAWEAEIAAFKGN